MQLNHMNKMLPSEKQSTHLLMYEAYFPICNGFNDFNCFVWFDVFIGLYGFCGFVWYDGFCGFICFSYTHMIQCVHTCNMIVYSTLSLNNISIQW